MNEKQRFPRKTTAELGLPGIDRAPLRLWRTAENYTPKTAIWVGPGSRWANPWIGVYEATSAAFISFFQPEMLRTSHRNRHYRPPTEEELTTVHAALFRMWIFQEPPDSKPMAVAAAIKRARSGNIVPEPWSVDEIRAALAGKDLADAVDTRCFSHADHLLKIANGASPCQK
jgi:hypothetical protein